MSINSSISEGERRMQATYKAYTSKLSAIRAGRASEGLVSHIQVDYYGNKMSVDQLARIVVSSVSSLVIEPWDESATEMVAKAIQASNLSITPHIEGNQVRVNLPPMSDEYRQEIVKLIRSSAEEAKVAVRNVRRDILGIIRALEKNGECSKDDTHRAQNRLQGITDACVKKIDNASSAKQSEITQT